VNTVQKYAYPLKFSLVIIGIPFVIGSFIYKWVFHSISVFNKIKLTSMISTGLSTSGISLSPPLALRLLAAAIEGISVILLTYGIVYFIKLLSNYCKGELFSEEIILCYRKIMWAALAWTIYNPLSLMILSIVTTINNPPGQRIISLTLQGKDIFHIFIVGSFLIINSLMQEAYKLKREQDLTV